MQFDNDILKRCWFLAGPTACGKSAAGCELAELLNAEMIALDVHYWQQWSLLSDLRILVKTPLAALSGRGAA